MQVSVLVAAYRATYLREALESARAQTYSNLELVVVDDSDGDEVFEIVNSLDDPRIRYVRNSTSLGPAGTHARALELSSGSVVGILNDDDIWRPQLVESLLGALQGAPNAVVAFSDHDVIVDRQVDEDVTERTSRQWGREVLRPGCHQPFWRQTLISKSVPLAIAALFRRSALNDEPMPDEVGGAYDFYLAYLLCRDGGGAVFVPERLAAWRVHSTNLTSVASPARSEEVAHVYRILIRDHRLDEIHDELVSAYGDVLWSVASRHLRWGSRTKALRATIESLRCGNYRSAALIPALVVPRRALVFGGRRRAKSLAR
jgi:glycosyltransferase involved in cell wall biosynthesis